MKNRKKAEGEAKDEKAVRNNLNRLFGRLAFEKGNACGRADEEGDPIARLKDDSIVTRKRIRSKGSIDDAKPPEAYPGP